jgi:hypothetical protein
VCGESVVVFALDVDDDLIAESRDSESCDAGEWYFSFDAIGKERGGRCDIDEVFVGDGQDPLLPLVDVIDLDDLCRHKDAFCV